MSKDKNLDFSKGPVRGWWYDPQENWWYHRHMKGIPPFRRKRFVETTSLNGRCQKCGKSIPDDLKKLVTRIQGT